MTEETYSLLVSLAQRRYPGTKHWYSSPRHYIGKEYICICSICGCDVFVEKIDFNRGWDFTPMFAHGKQHLKDSNLLPFL